MTCVNTKGALLEELEELLLDELEDDLLLEVLDFELFPEELDFELSLDEPELALDGEDVLEPDDGLPDDWPLPELLGSVSATRAPTLGINAGRRGTTVVRSAGHVKPNRDANQNSSYERRERR